MKKAIIYIILIILFFMGLWFYCRDSNDDGNLHRSNIDGNFYIVRTRRDSFENHTQNQEVADFLASISTKVSKLVSYMKKHNLPNSEIASRLSDRWKTCKLRETSSSEKSAAYTVNKGEELRLCVRYNDEMQDNNTAMFVILHELAHIMSISYGHNEEFKENFSFVVHLAADLGVYKPENFSVEPSEYCGTNINTTPCSGNTCKYGDESKVEWFGNIKSWLGLKK